MSFEDFASFQLSSMTEVAYLLMEFNRDLCVHCLFGVQKIYYEQHCTLLVGTSSTRLDLVHAVTTRQRAVMATRHSFFCREFSSTVQSRTYFQHLENEEIQMLLPSSNFEGTCKLVLCVIQRRDELLLHVPQWHTMYSTKLST